MDDNLVIPRHSSVQLPGRVCGMACDIWCEVRVRCNGFATFGHTSVSYPSTLCVVWHLGFIQCSSHILSLDLFNTAFILINPIKLVDNAQTWRNVNCHVNHLMFTYCRFDTLMKRIKFVHHRKSLTCAPPYLVIWFGQRKHFVSWITFVDDVQGCKRDLSFTKRNVVQHVNQFTFINSCCCCSI